MESDRAIFAALVLLGVIVGANLAMYALVRAVTGSKSNWIGTLQKSLRRPLQKKDNDMDELRKRVEELTPEDGKNASRK